jgi:hypothetical protein
MLTMLKLTKEEMKVLEFGLNIAICPRDDFEIIFDVDAALEFCKEVYKILEERETSRMSDEQYSDILVEEQEKIREYLPNYSILPGKRD